MPKSMEVAVNPNGGPARTTAAGRSHCAAVSRGLAEPLAATAPPQAGSWLAVEHTGPWPRRPSDTHLPVPAAGRILREAAALGIRTQLIRRSGRHRPPRHRRTVLLACTRGRQPWLERIDLDDLCALAELDLTALAAGRAPGFGAPSGHAELLVCTNGRRDACCAQHGQPVAAAIRAAHPGRAWETTHLGGDRFAGNVACLPHGTYHGRVTAHTAAAVAAACLADEVHLPHFRGRAGLPGPAQAAEHAVRLATGLVRLDAVTVEAVDHLGWVDLVRLRLAGRLVAVPVRTVRPGPPRPTSCAGCTLETPASYLTGTPCELSESSEPTDPPELPGLSEPPGARRGAATGGTRPDYRLSG